MNQFRWLWSLVVLLYMTSGNFAKSPNVVVIFADDLGYADVGSFGATGWKTPNLDRLASEGVSLKSFYVAQPVCSASRTALMTGCYPNRLGIHGALGPAAKIGLNPEETTLAEICKSKGYSTAAIGKWHMGSHPTFLPPNQGFDQYLGLPYSNDMWPHHPEAKKGAYPPLPLIDGDKVIDADVSPETQATLTGKYTERAVKFINDNKTKPFFLYMAHTFPHVPLYVSPKFKGSSKQGLYGDVIQEIDWSVGEVLNALKANGVADDTLVIFTSDNGPWLSYGNHAGTAGKLREGKGTVWEGGVRVPFIARYPGKIPANSTQTEPAMTIDLLPTIAKLIGAELPARPIDGKDIWPLLRVEPGAKSPQSAYYFYYYTNELQAVRKGQWKLVLQHSYRTMAGQAPGKDGIPGRYKMVDTNMALYDLANDESETTNVITKHPEVLKELEVEVEKARVDLGDAITKRNGKGLRGPGRVK